MFIGLPEDENTAPARGNEPRGVGARGESRPSRRDYFLAQYYGNRPATEIMALDSSDQVTVLRAMALVRAEWEGVASEEQLGWRDSHDFQGIDLFSDLEKLARDRLAGRDVYDPELRARLMARVPLAEMPEDYEPGATVRKFDSS